MAGDGAAAATAVPAETPSVSLVSIEMMAGLFNLLCRVEPEKSAELVFNCKLTLPVPFGRHADERDALKLLQSAVGRSCDSRASALPTLYLPL